MINNKRREREEANSAIDLAPGTGGFRLESRLGVGALSRAQKISKHLPEHSRRALHLHQNNGWSPLFLFSPSL